MATLVATFEKQAKDRLKEVEKELAPLESERDELRRALSGLSKPSAPRRRSNGRKSSPGREPKRAQEFVKLVAENPGITVSEISKRLDVKPNYLYRIAKSVVEAGEVKKEGKGYVKA